MSKRCNLLLWILVAIVASRLLTMWLVPLADTSEPRYADIARIMANSGDWITPWFEKGEPFWGKPPLSFWAAAASFKVFGVSGFAARLPSWLAHLGSLLLIMAAARRLADRRTALWSGLLFATMALPYTMAGAVLTDPFLTLGTTLTLVAFLLVLQAPSRVWGYAFFLGLAVGLLAKGPLALVLCGGPIFLWCLWTGRWRDLWQRLPWISGTLLMLALSLPWYIAAELKTPGFLDYFIVGEHFKRFVDPGWAGDRYGSAHQRPHGTIWLYWLLATLPWGLVGLGGLIWAWLKRPMRSQAARFLGDDDNRLLLLWALFPALFFTLAGNILWTYILPGTPALALLLARALVRPESGEPARLSRWLLAVAIGLPALATAGGIYISGHPEKIKTDMALITTYNGLPHPLQEHVLYLDSRSFSGRFYSGGTAQEVSVADINRLLQGHAGQPLYVVISGGKRDNAKAGVHGQLRLIKKGRRYSLYEIIGKAPGLAPGAAPADPPPAQ